MERMQYKEEQELFLCYGKWKKVEVETQYYLPQDVCFISKNCLHIFKN